MLKLNFTEHLTAYMLTATNQIRSLCVYVCVCVELTHNVLLIWASVCHWGLVASKDWRN